MTNGRNTTRLSVRLPDEAVKRLSLLAKQNNQSIGTYLRAILEQDVPARYLYLLEDGRRSLSGKFSPGELSLMVDVCNGTWWEPACTIHGGILANCEDTETVIYEKWGVDRASFLGKLRALPVVQQFALADAIERFWRKVSIDGQCEPGQILE